MKREAGRPHATAAALRNAWTSSLAKTFPDDHLNSGWWASEFPSNLSGHSSRNASMLDTTHAPSTSLRACMRLVPKAF